MQQGLSLNEVSVSHRGSKLFSPLSFCAEPGVVTTIMGPSGVGKSTLLSIICGTLDPVFSYSGEVLLNGRSLHSVPTEDRRVGILFQDDLLFPHLSVADNLAFGLPKSMTKQERRDRIETALTEADLVGYGSRSPATLSGGQRARVACLRALIAEPEALLLDEPFSKLDVELRERFRRFVFDHALRNALPVLLVTHDPVDAEAAAGPIITLT